MIPKPNFFIIGAPRCGTTALSEYLRSNPRIGFSNPKETQFFATDFPNIRFVQNEEDYLNKCFGHLEGNDYLAVGEASVWHLYSNFAVSEILNYNPEAKFIIMIRNPFELVQALYEKQVELHWEDCKTFENAWNIQNERRNGHNIPKHCNDVRLLMYADIGKLAQQIERVINIVPHKQLKIINFDDFKNNTGEIYRSILQFLEVPDDGRDTFPRINEGRQVKFRWLYQELSLPNASLMKIVNVAKHIFGIEKLNVLPRLRKLFIKPRAKKPPISDLVRAEMQVQFEGEIVQLSTILQRDLSHWLIKN